MKDNEKAKQIVDRIFECGFNTNRTFYDMALNSAMEMAEWKDEQLVVDALEIRPLRVS